MDDNDSTTSSNDKPQKTVRFALSDDPAAVQICHEDMTEEEVAATWYSQDEFGIMKAADEFTLMKLEYSRWARCSCCKGYSVCRGLELRCQKSLEAKNVAVANCRSMVLDEQTYSRAFHGTVYEELLAAKYEDFCNKDVQAALELGRLDAQHAERLLQECWQARSPEDEDAFLELTSNEDDDDAISEISFDGQYPVCETDMYNNNNKTVNRKIGIFRKTGRLLRRSLTPRRCR